MQFLKILAHPLMMPVYFLLVLFISFGYFSVNPSILLYLLLFVFITISLLPGLSLYMAGRTGLISRPLDPKGKDKRIAFLLLMVFSLVVCKMWHDKNPDALYVYVFATIAVVYAVLLFSNYLFEIDWFTTFWGALLGFYLILLQIGGGFSMLLLVALILFAALTAVFRPLENAGKTNFQLFAGYLIGAITSLAMGRVMVM